MEGVDLSLRTVESHIQQQQTNAPKACGRARVAASPHVPATDCIRARMLVALAVYRHDHTPGGRCQVKIEPRVAMWFENSYDLTSDSVVVALASTIGSRGAGDKRPDQH
jgi:hypothetical protein